MKSKICVNLCYKDLLYNFQSTPTYVFLLDRHDGYFPEYTEVLLRLLSNEPSEGRDLRSQSLRMAEHTLSPASTLIHYSVFSTPPGLEGLVTHHISLYTLAAGKLTLSSLPAMAVRIISHIVGNFRTWVRQVGFVRHSVSAPASNG